MWVCWYIQFRVTLRYLARPSKSRMESSSALPDKRGLMAFTTSWDISLTSSWVSMLSSAFNPLYSSTSAILLTPPFKGGRGELDCHCNHHPPFDPHSKIKRSLLLPLCWLIWNNFFIVSFFMDG